MQRSVERLRDRDSYSVESRGVCKRQLGLGRIGDQSFDAKAGSLENLFDFSRDRNAHKLFLDPRTGEPSHRRQYLWGAPACGALRGVCTTLSVVRGRPASGARALGGW